MTIAVRDDSRKLITLRTLHKETMLHAIDDLEFERMCEKIMQHSLGRNFNDQFGIKNYIGSSKLGRFYLVENREDFNNKLAFVIPFDHNDDINKSYTLLKALHKPVAFIILPIFAIVNTAILLPSNMLESLNTSNSKGIILGLAIGKLAGIFIFPFILVKLGVAKLQNGISWKNLAGIVALGALGLPCLCL